jgi:hypothetical protein
VNVDIREIIGPSACQAAAVGMLGASQTPKCLMQ